MYVARRLGVHQVQRLQSASQSRRRAGRRRTFPRARAQKAAPQPGRSADSTPPPRAAPTASREGAVSGRCGSASSRPSRLARRPSPPRRAARACALPQRCRHPRAPTSDPATTARPTRECRRPDASGAGSAGHVRRDRRPSRSIIVTASCGCSRTMFLGADRRRETPTSRCSSQAGRADRCRPARRSRGSGNAVARPPSRDRASSTSTRAPRRRQAHGGAQAREPGADHDDVVAVHVPQPLSDRDERLARPRHARARGEHVIAVALDAAQRLEVDRAHDLGGNQPSAIVGRTSPRVAR